MVGVSCVALTAPVLVSATPASAGRPGDCPATCIAGSYTIRFRWQSDHRWIPYPLELRADHTGWFGDHALLVTWTKKQGVFTMSFDVDDGLITGSYVGYRNQHDGFCNRQRYGTMSNSEGNTGIWYAKPAPAPTSS